MVLFTYVITTVCVLFIKCHICYIFIFIFKSFLIFSFSFAYITPKFQNLLLLIAVQNGFCLSISLTISNGKPKPSSETQTVFLTSSQTLCEFKSGKLVAVGIINFVFTSRLHMKKYFLYQNYFEYFEEMLNSLF